MNSPDYGRLPPNAPSWCHAPFDPEGLLSSVMAIITCIIGLHLGHVVVHFKDHKQRILQWMILSFCFVLLGLVLDFYVPVLQGFYSLESMCWLMCMHGYRRATKLAEWMGMHALAIYILVARNIIPVVLQGFYWRSPENNIFKLP